MVLGTINYVFEEKIQLYSCFTKVKSIFQRSKVKCLTHIYIIEMIGILLLFLITLEKTQKEDLKPLNLQVKIDLII